MKNNSAVKKEKRVRRHNRIRAKLVGTADRPRLALFRSNRYLYAQLIDDEGGKTIASVDSRKTKGETKREKIENSGTLIAAFAKEKGVNTVIFDRGGFLFAGSIKAFADAARKGGLTF